MAEEDTASSNPELNAKLSKVNETQGATGTSQTSSSFSTALQTWTQIDLPSLQKKLDIQGLELKDDQANSLLRRKNLATKTKEFRKLEDPDKLDQIKGLLKLYQNEIDSLTNKKKDVEGYFFGFYRLLAEAPDPRPLLELSLDAVIASSETESLRKEVSKLNDELSKKADYDQLKQRLLRNEQKSAELLSSKLHAKEEEFKALIDEKQSNWLEKEKNYEKQIHEFKAKMDELRTSKEVTELQLTSHNKQLGNTEINSSASALAELEIVSRDAESAKKRVFELEKRNEELRRELSRSNSDVERKNLKEEYEKKVSELEGENALLIANLDQHRKKLDNITKENSNKTDSFNREITQLTQEVKNCKEKLEKTSDYDEIKRELYLIRQIEFGNDDDGVDSDETDNSRKQIDSLLIQRNKVLTQELADLRSQHDDLTSRINHLDSELNTVNEELIKAQELNQRLENDLAGVQDGQKFNDNMSMISGVSRINSGRPKNGSITSLNTTGSSPVTGDASSILPIITKQRDRFRDRNNELEDDLRKQYSIVSDLKRQMNSLKKDNEELYERTRYLASFKKGNDTGSTESQSFSSRTANRKLLQPKPNSIDLERNPYQKTYESKLHPIEQFRVREQERINSKLSPIERLFISLTRAILATRTTRMLFMVYCFGLHCVVMFITIYAMGLSTRMIPEVGMNHSTGGVANGIAGSPDSPGNLAEPVP
mmetsp:Transcript_5782/g.6946  ORF Transcript_5782/g.6946 Transcript_5782/m.6946 type:complete len:714 (+) Transcript_5782:6907-9048(+)